MKRLAPLSLLWLAGCAQLLGLDDTTFDPRDAASDSPLACDRGPACAPGSLCGQLVGTGELAGQPIRFASPLAIFAQPLASYAAGGTSDRVVGAIDDCGGFVVRGLDDGATDIAVVVTAADLVASGALVLAGSSTSEIVVPVVETTTARAWGAGAGGAFLVSYVDARAVPLASAELRVDGAGVGGPPRRPWGAYFGGPLPFGAIDSELGATQASGTALLAPPPGTFQLGGTGASCTPVLLQAVPGALVHVRLRC